MTPIRWPGPSSPLIIGFKDEPFREIRCFNCKKHMPLLRQHQTFDNEACYQAEKDFHFARS